MPMKEFSQLQRVQVERELASVLESAIFLRAPAVSRILSYVCKTSLDGEPGSLKEYNIAVDALGRDPDFDPNGDSIVRVEVSRLRKRLRQYYEAEGADHEIRIVIPEIGYIPKIIYNLLKEPAAEVQDEFEGDPAGRGQEPDSPILPLPAASEAPASIEVSASRSWSRFSRIRVFGTAAILTVAALGILKFAPLKNGKPRVSSVNATRESRERTASSALAPEIRIACGFVGPRYVDSRDQTWLGDRYFTGGNIQTRTGQRVLGTLDPALYSSGREGNFRYDIPLPPGDYELHLHFAETAIEPTPEFGGDNARRFSVSANGKTLLQDFDIVRDAAGTSTADEKIFKDISPAPDGFLHLSVYSFASRGLPNGIEVSSFGGKGLLNGIEIVPGIRGRMRPVRIVCGARNYVDHLENAWSADRYFLGGSLTRHWNTIRSTDPGHYETERWGYFSYSIPVAENGVYDITLKMTEPYYGPSNPGKGGAGDRVFDVYCNGMLALANFDVFVQAGGENRAIDKTLRGIKPNPQGKIVLNFVPIKGYANVCALEVIDRTPASSGEPNDR